MFFKECSKLVCSKLKCTCAIIDSGPVELATRATLQMSHLSSDDDDDDTGVWINLASEVSESIDRAALALPTD